MVTIEEKINKLIKDVENGNKNSRDIKESLEELKSEIEIKENEIQELKRQLELSKLGIHGVIPTGIEEVGNNSIIRHMQPYTIHNDLEYEAWLKSRGIKNNTEREGAIGVKIELGSGVGAGIGMGVVEAGMGMEKDVTVEKELEMAKKKVDTLERILKEKNTEIKQLREYIEKKEVNQNLIAAVEMIAKSATNARIPTPHNQ